MSLTPTVMSGSLFQCLSENVCTLDSANDGTQNEVAYVVLNIDMPRSEPVTTGLETWDRSEWYRVTDLLMYTLVCHAFLPLVLDRGA
jgi:hypothetical protein